MTARKGHPKSRPLPGPPPMPAHLVAMQSIAMIGTLGVPIGAGLPAIYLAAARALIEAARQMQREAHDCGGCAPPVITGGPRFTATK